MSRTPGGKEILQKMPVGQWFVVSDEVKRAYLEIPSYDLNNCYNAVIKQLYNLAKWTDKCIRKEEGRIVFWCI